MLFRLGVCATLLAAFVSTAGAQVINEIRIDQPGTDNDEYIELAGAPGLSLDGLSIIVIGDGNATTTSGVIEAVISLNGRAIAADGYFLIAESTLTLGTADLTVPSAELNLENGDNVTFLLVSEFTGANGNDLDTNNDGTLDLQPWADEVDRIAVIEADNPPPTGVVFHYGPPTVGPAIDGAGMTFSPAHVFRCPDGAVAGTFEVGTLATGVDDSAGAVNAACPAPPDASVPPTPDAGLPGTIDAGGGGPTADAGGGGPTIDAGGGEPTADAGNGPGADAGGGPGADAGGPTPDIDAGSDAPDAGGGTGGSGGGGGTGGGTGGSGGGTGDDDDGDDDGGCCSANGQGTPGNLLLALLVAGALFYRRRRTA